VDQRWGIREYEPIGRSVFASHLEARTRLLRFAMEQTQTSIHYMASLERLRSRVERWTDLLLSACAPETSAAYAFDRHRLTAFRNLRTPTGSCRLSIVRVAAQRAFAEAAPLNARRAALHEAVHAAICGSFGPELLLTYGPMLSGWQARLLFWTDDRFSPLSHWLAEQAGSEPPG
jgi:hypothetical protein